jgi:hypothetical protein
VTYVTAIGTGSRSSTVTVRVESASIWSSVSSATPPPASRFNDRASALASAPRMRTQPCDAALPMELSNGVPWRKYKPPNRTFTGPMGFKSPGGWTVSFRAHSLGGGYHHGFQVMCVM